MVKASFGTQGTVSLSPSTQPLEEVIVTGYGELKKKEMTASVATVLQGKSAGISINRNYSPGYIKDEELVELYNCASVYCQPSLYEGFGLPVLEAMSCGCPVVCTKTSALEEIAGDAALFADSYNSRDIASKLSDILEQPEIKNTLITKGYKNIERFSWENCAQETLDVYRKVLNL